MFTLYKKTKYKKSKKGSNTKKAKASYKTKTAKRDKRARMKANMKSAKKMKKVRKMKDSKLAKSSKLELKRRGRPAKRLEQELDSETARVYKKFHVLDAIKEEIKNEAKFKKKPQLSSYTPEQIEAAINMIKSNDAVKEYLTNNVSSLTLSVMDELKAPATDEAIAAKLNIKINAVRRILNILQNYGITNYYIAKNTNGWLSFAWYINVDKIPSFINSIIPNEEKKDIEIDENCNDYFICPSCYKETKIIVPFDSAFENNFKCSFCSASLERVDKEQFEEAAKN